MSYSPALTLRRSYPSLPSPTSPTYGASPPFATAPSQITYDGYGMEQLANAKGHDSDPYGGSSLPVGSWSPEHRKQHSLGQPSSFLSASQGSSHFQSIRQPAPPPLQLHTMHHHLTHSHSMSDLSGLDSMKSMTLTSTTPRQSAPSYNPLNNPHLHIPVEHYADDNHTEEWPQSATSSTFPQQEDVKY